MYEIHVIRLSEETCVWVIKDIGQNVVAKSTLMGPMSVVRPEAETMSRWIGNGGAVIIEGGIEKKGS